MVIKAAAVMALILSAFFMISCAVIKSAAPLSSAPEISDKIEAGAAPGAGGIPEISAPAENSIPQESAPVTSTPEPVSVTPVSVTTLSVITKDLKDMRIERVTIESTCLNKAMKLNVYLPGDYDKGKRCSVLYLLHGTSYNQNQWESQFDLPKKAIKVFKSGRAEPYIIVTPAIGTSYGLNSEPPAKPVRPVIKGDYGRYEDYIMRELIPYIDSRYNTIAHKEGRFIGGVSMGGFAALRLSFLYPGHFGKVGAHSPALWQHRKGESLFSLSSINFVYPDEESKKTRDPLELVKDAYIAEGVKIWLDCGDRDFYEFYVGTETMYEALKSKGADVECHIMPGRHKKSYWIRHIEEYLIFYGS